MVVIRVFVFGVVYDRCRCDVIIRVLIIVSV